MLERVELGDEERATPVHAVEAQGVALVVQEGEADGVDVAGAEVLAHGRLQGAGELDEVDHGVGAPREGFDGDLGEDVAALQDVAAARQRDVALVDGVGAEELRLGQQARGRRVDDLGRRRDLVLEILRGDVDRGFDVLLALGPDADEGLVEPVVAEVVQADDNVLGAGDVHQGGGRQRGARFVAERPGLGLKEDRLGGAPPEAPPKVVVDGRRDAARRLVDVVPNELHREYDRRITWVFHSAHHIPRPPAADRVLEWNADRDVFVQHDRVGPVVQEHVGGNQRVVDDGDDLAGGVVPVGNGHRPRPYFVRAVVGRQLRPHREGGVALGQGEVVPGVRDLDRVQRHGDDVGEGLDERAREGVAGAVVLVDVLPVRGVEVDEARDGVLGDGVDGAAADAGLVDGLRVLLEGRLERPPGILQELDEVPVGLRLHHLVDGVLDVRVGGLVRQLQELEEFGRGVVAHLIVHTIEPTLLFKYPITLTLTLKK